MVLMEVNGGFSNNPQSSYPQVVLKEAEGNSYLHIIIGRFEAAAISMAHGHQQPERPISYDLACQILSGVDACVARIDITDLHEGTYYAEIHLVDEEGAIHVLDARPSDAIALALRFDAPIYAAAEVLEEAGHARSIGEPDAESISVSQQEHSNVAAPEVNHLDQLKRRMRQAIAEEVYEEAARLRDEISRLEKA